MCLMLFGKSNNNNKQVIILMNSGLTAIQSLGILMTRASIEISTVLELVETLNNSYFQCQHVVTILSQIFQRQKSGKILTAVQILEYLVKNCNKNFHQAANKASFQKNVLGLLKRLRGKSSFLKDLRSNTDNWNKIQAKILYLIQLWYDAFILQESVYNNIINTYKTLRQQNILFPPRSSAQKNLLFVKTQSPIFQNIQDIARRDHQKFGKTLNSLGLQKTSQKMELIEVQVQKKQLTRKIDVDQISQRIAIVRSNGCQGKDMLKLIQQIKKDLEYGKVEPSQQQYWKDIKEASQSVIQEWENTNAELIKQYQRDYLEAKMGKMSIKQQKKEEGYEDNEGMNGHQEVEKIEHKPTEQINLLDL